MSLFDESDQLLARPKYENSFRIFNFLGNTTNTNTPGVGRFAE
jgi:hypothetical protein